MLELCKVVDEDGELPYLYDVEGTYTEDDLVIAFCYFHTQYNINGKKHSFVVAANYDTFKQDVGHLRQVSFAPLRERAFVMLMSKYNAKSEVYITEWFATYWWGNKWGTWPDGNLPAGKPPHMSGEEGTHHWIQTFVTEHSTLPIDEFHGRLLQFSRRESVFHAQNPLPDVCPVDVSTWRAAIMLIELNVMEYAMKAPANMPVRDGDGQVYIVPTDVNFKQLKGTSVPAKKFELAIAVATFLAVINDPDNLPRAYQLSHNSWTLISAL
ncbi:hypothetical protein CYMTET_28222 [Cymbomonas tetramitiformis]|uniref:Uncharacterized protein n=1 Tax=Cymbomonas tetramitiformis TaxID=36881 RepID=A0AAE0KW43_9CHLO|nr:hypothetical protein CYMTET_28222 [Cymbomonas tetramitiformis]|eukprot:gene22383-27005_t